MRARLYRFFIELSNGPLTSRALKRFSCSRLSRPFIKSYARFYRINHEEMLEDIAQYPNLHAFFTRKLKAAVRPVDRRPDIVTSPVDGVLEEVGLIHPTKEIIVKNKTYSVSEMLGSKEKAEKYSGGIFMIIYLSPSHYHRIHSPVNGKVAAVYSRGSRSYPVNRFGLKYGKSALSKNYRVITEMMTDGGSVAMIKVGAMFINSVIVTNHNKMWQKGEEVAYFSFGSTVILLFEKNRFKLNDKIKPKFEVKMGTPIGQFHSDKNH
ncbi:phosphatidylserine decarboxylase [Siminovitchia sp. 179-K 8D1 HS]|uniref:phosphatidylserine decarboxylase n=1 Tax=Siminovitchia sp. 179-K 8D1 HS TaxID=3142385 RepID=UPI0039A26144